MNIRNVRQLKILIFTLIAIVTLGIGYAGITAINLVINGDAIASVNNQNFKVKFLNESGVTPTITGEGNIISVKDDITAEFSVSTLTGLGDSEVATFRVKNESKGIGADISLSVTSSNSEYFKVTEYVQDTQLQAGDETTVTVTVEMTKTPIESDVSTSITAKLIANAIEDEVATGSSPATKVAGDPESFAEDSWATIKKAVHNGNTSMYNVGDTKTVTINGTNYTVRIANKSTNANCGSETYSETACGFVVEFAEPVESRAMNSIDTNVGGWPATTLHIYLHETFYNNLQSDLKAAIISTKVISSYANNGTDSMNFKSDDKLFLLEVEEIFGGTSSFTTQLDYYRINNVTKQNSGNFTKKGNGYYWLRSVNFATNNCFMRASSNVDYNTAVAAYGIAPAFRIG